MTERKDHISKRINLDSLEKKNVYEVKQSYFDELPTRIQDRVIAKEKKSNPVYLLTSSLKFALPVIALIMMAVYFGNRYNAQEVDVLALIDEVSTEELVAYLNSSDLGTDEIIALIDVEELDIDGMLNEDIILLDDIEFDAVLEDYPDLETDF